MWRLQAVSEIQEKLKKKAQAMRVLSDHLESPENTVGSTVVCYLMLFDFV